jgi:lycopene beta-cyclase
MILIVGGGLSGSLLAYRLAQLKNPPSFVLLESNESLGGNHTWSFHHSDLNSMEHEWVQPLISKSWSKQEVHFRDQSRQFNQPYHSITSKDLDQKLRAKLKDRVRLNAPVKTIQKNQVTLESGEVLSAQIVFDGRGVTKEYLRECGYQKFLGADLELDHPHGLESPIIMDARCEQKDGFRFFYLLPWSKTQILIEDTRYSNTSDINSEEFIHEIHRFCDQKGWKVKTTLRTEAAALPIPLHAHSEILPPEGPFEIGLRGGFFHLTTGYSFADSVATADAITTSITTHPPGSVQDIRSELEALQSKIFHQAKFFGLLNRMLFKAANPDERWLIFSRFYRLPEDLIFRFYRGELKRSDQLRLLIGKPPVSIWKALQQINP